MVICPRNASTVSGGRVELEQKRRSVVSLDKEELTANTSVLDLDVTKPVESLLVGIIKKTKGVEEADTGT